jgi:hypothetical protein
VIVRRRPTLDAIDDVVVSVAHSPRLNAGSVRAGSRLGNVDVIEFVFLQDRIEVGFLLPLGSVLKGRMRIQKTISS